MDTQTLPPQVGELIEKGQQATVNAAKTAVSDVSGSVASQIGIKNETNSAQTQNPAQNPPAAEPSNQASQEDLEATRDMVKDYYSPSQVAFNASQAELEEQQRQSKLANVRQKLAIELHDEVYFNKIRDAGTSKPQAQISEQEKVEEEKKDDKMADLQVQQKKDDDISKFRAQRQVEIKGDIVG